MEMTLEPRRLRGTITMIPSKSQAHRLLICAAFAQGETYLICPDTNQDIEATAQCLRALGAGILRTGDGYAVTPAASVPETAVLPCRESGSTLRFMLPVAGALGVDATFRMEGRLPERPLSPLWEELERMGCELSRPSPDTVRCRGRLRPGAYAIDGGVSSQFITGLMLALSLLPEESTLRITGKVESRPYIDITREAISLFGGDPDRPGSRPLVSPGTLSVEGDWSNAAFFLAANAMGNDVTVLGLNENSVQGDRVVTVALEWLTEGYCVINAANIPDLVPILAIVAGSKHGATFTNIGRLRQKESDRVASVAAMIEALGGTVTVTEDTLRVYHTGYGGGTVDAYNDHRIAMAAAIASTVCGEPVTILGAQCVRKSYPKFWEEFERIAIRTW